jgi:hypothetical protein
VSPLNPLFVAPCAVRVGHLLLELADEACVSCAAAANGDGDGGGLCFSHYAGGAGGGGTRTTEKRAKTDLDLVSLKKQN